MTPSQSFPLSVSLPKSYCLPGQLHHAMLPGGSVTDGQHHSENKIPPNFQSGEKNS